MRITAEELREKGDCGSAIQKLKEHWPHGATITKANCLLAAKLRLDVDWAAPKYLSQAAFRAWAERNDESRDQYRIASREAAELRDTNEITPKECGRRRVQAEADDYKRAWLAFWRCWRSMQKNGAAKKKK